MSLNAVNESATSKPWRAGRIAGSCRDSFPTSYIPFPVGEYQLEIVESDYVTNSTGTGNILKCKAQVVGGDFDQRPFYINYDLENDNPDAQEIGQREFARLRRAVGVLAPENSAELHWKRFRVKLHADGPVQYLFDEPADLRRAA